MPTNKPKIIFTASPKSVTLDYQDPKIKEYASGNSYMYSVNNTEIFFATQTLHEMIQQTGAKQGDTLKIIKGAELDNDGQAVTKWQVIPVNINPHDNISPTVQQDTPPSASSGTTPAPPLQEYTGSTVLEPVERPDYTALYRETWNETALYFDPQDMENIDFRQIVTSIFIAKTSHQINVPQHPEKLEIDLFLYEMIELLKNVKLRKLQSEIYKLVDERIKKENGKSTSPK